MRLTPQVKCFIVVSLLVASAATGRPASACAPESYFLFRSEARLRLDSLNARPTDRNAFERLVLMHNLAFHGDKEQRENAEKLLDTYFPKKQRSPIVGAFAGALKMIKVSHRAKGSNVIRLLSPLTKSPYSEAREGYRQISFALSRDTANVVLRILRATAAAESAEYLHELFDSARIDLEWLQSHADKSDSVRMFLIHLNWAKYDFKLAKENRIEIDSTDAAQQVDRAGAFACTPVYRLWAEEWRSRIKVLELDSREKK